MFGDILKTALCAGVFGALFINGASALPAAGDRVYTGDQFSNTVSIIDPANNRTLGVIRLGDPQPGNFSPLYRGQLLVHGLGFSPDHRTIVAVAIGSNSVSFIDTATNVVKHVTYLGRSPHEAFFTPDGKEVWVTVRGENYISVIDPATYEERSRITVPNGPGMQIFSPDGRYAYVCSSFTPETEVITIANHKIVGHVPQASAFCPNIAVTSDGSQVWFTLKDVGKVQVFNGTPPFSLIKTLDTGPITNHVNFADTPSGRFAYVTVGGLDTVKVFRTSDFQQVASIPVGALPHGLWPSTDGSRIYVGLENGDQVIAIDTSNNKVVASMPVGQGPQALVYVPSAASSPADNPNLIPLGIAANAVHIALASPGKHRTPVTDIALFDQGIVQVLQGAATQLAPGQHYVLGLTSRRDGSGPVQALQEFTTNPAGAAIVTTVGPLRQIIGGNTPAQRTYLVIAKGTKSAIGKVVQTTISK